MKKIVMLLILCGLIVTGCGEGGGHQTIKERNYYEGSDGLVMDFMTNNPPEKMYPEQTYPITMTIKNMGAFSLLESYSDDDLFAQATLIYDPFYFGEVGDFQDTAREVREEIHLEGKSLYWPSGQSKVMTLAVIEAKTVGPNRIGADSDIGVSLCFPYETMLGAQVCVDNDPYENTDPSQVCHVEDLSFVDQGAPVAIKHVGVETVPIGTQRQNVLVRQGVTDENGALTGFEEVMSEELVTIIRPVFRISIDNVGDGQVIRGRERGEQKLCLKEEWDDLPSNSLVVTAFLGNTELSCAPDPVIMYDDHAEVVCMLKPEDDMVVTTNYYDFLRVYIDYVYQIRDKITVQIDDSLRQYAPPSLTDFTCMDFDNDYASCRSYSQSAGAYNDNLDCFYCDSLKKCFERSFCDDCPDGSIADEYARKCSSPCPTPSASVVADTGTGKATLTCRDNSLMDPNDRKRCGCGAFAYQFIEDTGTSCPPSTSGSYATTIDGVYDGAMRATTAEIDLPDYVKNGDSWLMCVIGMTSGSGATSVSIPAKADIYYIFDRLDPVYNSNANSLA